MAVIAGGLDAFELLTVFPMGALATGGAMVACGDHLWTAEDFPRDRRAERYLAVSEAFNMVAPNGHAMSPPTHVGFKLVSNGTNVQLFATQADGTTENASASLGNISNVSLDLIAVGIVSLHHVDAAKRASAGADPADGFDDPITRRAPYSSIAVFFARSFESCHTVWPER